MKNFLEQHGWIFWVIAFLIAVIFVSIADPMTKETDIQLSENETYEVLNTETTTYTQRRGFIKTKLHIIVENIETKERQTVTIYQSPKEIYNNWSLLIKDDIFEYLGNNTYKLIKQ